MSYTFGMNVWLAASGSFPPVFVLLAIVLSSVVVVSIFLSKFRQSLLVGYFLCGILICFIHNEIFEILLFCKLGKLSAITGEINIYKLLLYFYISRIFKIKAPLLLAGIRPSSLQRSQSQRVQLDKTGGICLVVRTSILFERG